MRTPLLIACIAATSAATAAATSGLWWYATMPDRLALPMVSLRPTASAPEPARPAARAPALSTASAPGAALRPRAELPGAPAAANAGWGQATASWGEGATSAAAPGHRDVAGARGRIAAGHQRALHRADGPGGCRGQRAARAAGPGGAGGSGSGRGRATR